MLQSQLAKVFGVIYQIDVKISSVLYHVTMHLGDWGKSLNQFISLVALPFALAGVVSFCYWMFKHTTMPNVMTVVWVTWAIMMVVTSVHFSEQPVASSSAHQQTNTE